MYLTSHYLLEHDNSQKISELGSSQNEPKMVCAIKST